MQSLLHSTWPFQTFSILALCHFEMQPQDARTFRAALIMLCQLAEIALHRISQKNKVP